jgi:TonB family protein
MNSYLEMSDYKRAQDMLNEFYNAQKANKPNAQASYIAVAGQIVRGARNRIERYNALGLNVADRTLPLEAVTDIEKMRDTLEVVITQSKEIGKEKAKTSDAMALLEEAANSRSMMARDDYDARRWRDEVGDAREQLTSSRSVVLNAVNDSTGDTVAQNTVNTAGAIPISSPGSATLKPIGNAGVSMPVPVALDPTSKSSEKTLASVNNDKPLVPNVSTAKPAEQKPVQENKPATPNENPENGRYRYVPNTQEKTDEVRMQKPITPAKEEPKIQVPNVAPVTQTQTPNTTAATDVSKDGSPMDVGSLIAYATKQAQPVYPPAARTMRTTGVVKVEVTVDENGDVTEVQHTSGPSLLQTAAKEAVRRWKFRPFTKDGQPVKATGFVNFIFSL